MDIIHYPVGSIRRWGTVVIKGWTCSGTILRKAAMFKRRSNGSKGPKVCQQNVPHTITPTAPFWTVGWLHVVMLFTPNSDPPIWISQQESVCLFSCDLSHQPGISVHMTAADWIFPVFGPLCKPIVRPAQQPSKSLNSPFFPILTLALNIFVTSTCLNASSDWLISYLC